MEPILIPDNQRYVLFPIKDNEMWEMYLKQVSSFWRSEEIDLSRDREDWKALSNDERHFVSMILAFFAASDGIIIENLACRFLNEVQLAEARSFYSFQMAMENIHSQTYSLLIDSYIDDKLQKQSMFEAIDNFSCVAKKAQWAQKYITTSENFATRLVAFACVEGIHFSGAFASIFWLKKRGLLPGLTFSNELISRDEALHTEFAILLYKRLLHPLTFEEIKEIICEAVDCEIEFICDALPCRLLGMNSILMTQYIQFIADRLSVQLGYEKIYYKTNPFEFMEFISIEQKTNFFEKRVSEYALTNNYKDECVFEFSNEGF
jgi:ribonucleoside-diphosphate reductase subunit M2